jgi:hypothetical protein
LIALLGAFAATTAARADDPVSLLHQQFPSVRVHNAGPNFKYFFGAPMSAGLTEAAAAGAFLTGHGAALGGPLQAGLGSLDVRELWKLPSRDGRFVAFAYRQMIRGKEVDGSDIRIKVRCGPVPRVDYAAARLAGEPTAGSESPVLSAQVAAMVAQSLSGTPELTVEGTPELVVLRGNNTRPDWWCWRVHTRLGQGILHRRATYYVDTVAPRIVHKRENFHNFHPPTTGTVEARGTSTSHPILPYRGPSTPLVNHRMPGARVNGTVGTQSGSVYTNNNGQFELNVGKTNQAIVVSSTLQDPGQWYRVYYSPPTTPEYLSETETVEVGAAVPLALANTAMSEERRVAQADLVFSINRARNFFLNYISTSAPGLSYPVFIAPSQIGGITPCNAGAAHFKSPFNLYALVFAPSNVECWNFATHSWAGHEFGHVALFMIDLVEQNTAFHEGYADTYANLLNDDSVQGRQQFVNGANVRDDPTSSGINCQYPIPNNTTATCTCAEIHSAGQLLSGPWVRIRNASGLEHARTLFGQWSLVTVGGDADCGSAHPGTVAELLSITDSLVDLNLICTSFAAHGITIPECSSGWPP